MTGEDAFTPFAPRAVLLKRAMGTLAGRALVLGLSFLFAVLLARVLQPTERGQFALLQALNGVAGIVGNLAVSGAIIHHVGKRRLTLGRAVGAAAVLAVISTLIAGIVFIPTAVLLRAQLFAGIPLGLIIAAVLLSATVFARDYEGGVLISAGRSTAFVVSHALQPVGGLVALTIIVLAGAGSLGTVTTAWAAGLTVSAIAALAVASRAREREHVTLSRADMGMVVRFGLRTYPALVARFLNLRVDQFLVAILASAAALGQYAVAVNVGELVIQIPVVMLWAVSGAISSHPPEESAEMVANFCRWIVIVLVASSGVIAAVAPSLVPIIFGNEYAAAGLLVLLLLPGMVAYGPAILIAEFFIVQRGQPVRAALIGGTGVLSSVIFNLILTPQFGAKGASVASSASYMVMLGVAAVLFTSNTTMGVGDLFRFSRGDFVSLIQALRPAVLPFSRRARRGRIER